MPAVHATIRLVRRRLRGSRPRLPGVPSPAVARGGFDEATARRAATALLHFLLGHVSHEQQRLQYDSLGVLADPADPVAAGAGASGERADDPATDFAFGVDLFAGGLERLRVGELSRPRR